MKLNEMGKRLMREKDELFILSRMYYHLSDKKYGNYSDRLMYEKYDDLWIKKLREINNFGISLFEIKEERLYLGKNPLDYC